MTLAVIVLVLAVVAGLALAVVVIRVVVIRKDAEEKRAGIQRFGGVVLQSQELRIGADTHLVTPGTHAEVVGGVQEGRRSTATRTAAGAVVGGIPGALVGHAAKKKTRSSSAMLTVNGDDWTHTVTVEPKSYADAVRFAHAVNLAARTSANS